MVWCRSTVIAILSSLIKDYTTSHSQQSDQGLHYLPFSAVWSMSRCILLFSGTVWSRSTLFTILSNLISLYTICFSQSDQRLHYLPFSAVWSGSTLFAILSKQYYHGLHCLTISAVWSGPTQFAILSSLIRVYTICLSQQSDQGIHCLPFS